VSVDARQLDAFVSPSRVGGCLEVARDEMLDRVDRGEPVAWVAAGNAGTVLHGWIATRFERGGRVLWRVTRIGSGDKVRAWTTKEVTQAIASAEALLDPDSDRCLHARTATAGSPNSPAPTWSRASGTRSARRWRRR